MFKRIIALFISLVLLVSAASLCVAENLQMAIVDTQLTQLTDGSDVVHYDYYRALFTVCAYVDCLYGINQIEEKFGITSDDLSTIFQNNTYLFQVGDSYMIWGKLSDGTMIDISYTPGQNYLAFMILNSEEENQDLADNWNMLDAFYDSDSLYKNDSTSIYEILQSLSESLN